MSVPAEGLVSAPIGPPIGPIPDIDSSEFPSAPSAAAAGSAAGPPSAAGGAAAGPPSGAGGAAAGPPSGADAPSSAPAAGAEDNSSCNLLCISLFFEYFLSICNCNIVLTVSKG